MRYAGRVLVCCADKKDRRAEADALQRTSAVVLLASEPDCVVCGVTVGLSGYLNELGQSGELGFESLPFFLVVSP